MYEVEATADLLFMTGQAKPVTESNAPEVSAETSLITAVLAGDRDLYGRLYDTYAPLVHGILLARVPRDEVEDLLQDIFLHALRKLHTLRDRAA